MRLSKKECDKAIYRGNKTVVREDYYDRPRYYNLPGLPEDEHNHVAVSSPCVLSKCGRDHKIVAGPDGHSFFNPMKDSSYDQQTYISTTQVPFAQYLRAIDKLDKPKLAAKLFESAEKNRAAGNRRPQAI